MQLIREIHGAIYWPPCMTFSAILCENSGLNNAPL